MKFEYNGICVHYEIYGNKSSHATLLLHGWGSDGGVFEGGGLIDNFDNRYFVVPDFPPFGKSTSQPSEWTIFSYVNMLISLCEHLNICSVDVVGHSFGGRIAILLSSLNCTFVHSCVLIDSAGMRPRLSIKRKFKILSYKIKKRLCGNVDNFGSNDYQALPPCMKGVFVNIVNTFLEPYLDKISARTLIVWGKNDCETPIYMAKRLNKSIKNSRLVVLEGGHYSFLDSPLTFYRNLREFWEGK